MVVSASCAGWLATTLVLRNGKEGITGGAGSRRAVALTYDVFI